jgi:hypothetical protein
MGDVQPSPSLHSAPAYIEWMDWVQVEAKQYARDNGDQ